MWLTKKRLPFRFSRSCGIKKAGRKGSDLKEAVPEETAAKKSVLKNPDIEKSTTKGVKEPNPTALAAHALTIPALVNPARATPVEINELVELIFSFLDHTTLQFTAAPVSRRWYIIARPLFDLHLHLHPQNQNSWKHLDQSLLLASKVTIGSSPAVSLETPDEIGRWNTMTTRLIQAVMSIQARPKDQMRIQRLHLWMESWFLSQEQILAMLSPSCLTELSVVLPRGTGPFVNLGEILHRCPNLLSLSIVRRVSDITSNMESKLMELDLHMKREVIAHIFSRTDSNADKSTDARKFLPLRSLRLENFRISPHALRSYFPLLGQLTELRVLLGPYVYIRTDSDVFHAEAAARAFWRDLAGFCPLLESMHLNSDVQDSCDIPLGQFLNLRSLGSTFKRNVASTGLSLSNLLSVNLIENRLTTLEIIPGSTRSYSAGKGELKIQGDKLLRRFLVSSPQLLHLKVDKRISLSSNVLLDQQDPTTIWACRGLITLTIHFNRWSRGQMSSRQVFGYLARLCPKIQEISLSLYCSYPVYDLRSGLCLLTRMKDLRHLEIDTQNEDISSGMQFPSKSDFSWIQAYSLGNPCSGSGPSTDSMTSTTIASSPCTTSIQSATLPGSLSIAQSSTSTDRPATETNSRHTYVNRRDVEQCLKKIQELCVERRQRSQTDVTSESGRRRVLRQQQDNQYRSDYDRAIPMVDGLVDMDICGTFVDIESCLLAQLYHFHGGDRETEEGGIEEEKRDLEWQPGQQHVWPRLRRVTFWFSSRRPGNASGTESQSILSQLRPFIDFEFLCS